MCDLKLSDRPVCQELTVGVCAVAAVSSSEPWCLCVCVCRGCSVIFNLQSLVPKWFSVCWLMHVDCVKWVWQVCVRLCQYYYLCLCASSWCLRLYVCVCVNTCLCICLCLCVGVSVWVFSLFIAQIFATLRGCSVTLSSGVKSRMASPKASLDPIKQCGPWRTLWPWRVLWEIGGGWRLVHVAKDRRLPICTETIKFNST